ncbi:MAG: hypothetical protein IPN17_02960 [Deltaproteobacteria bacterium]|nr:hypothetical protein [Deltaproteobacteria bacterium]
MIPSSANLRVSESTTAASAPKKSPRPLSVITRVCRSTLSSSARAEGAASVRESSRRTFTKTHTPCTTSSGSSTTEARSMSLGSVSLTCETSAKKPARPPAMKGSAASRVVWKSTRATSSAPLLARGALIAARPPGAAPRRRTPAPRARPRAARGGP